MKRLGVTRRAAAFYAVLIGAIAVAGWFAYSTIYDTASSASSGVARTVTVSSGTVASSVSASGNISPAETSSPTFSTSGTLTSLNAAVGRQVKKGQVLGRISATDAQSTLSTAEATLQKDLASLATAKAGGTPSEIAQNNASLSSAKLQLTSAEQTLASDQTTLATARKQLVADEALGCPASSSGSSSNASSLGNSSSSNSSSSSSSSSSGSTAGGSSASSPSTSGGSAKGQSPSANALTATAPTTTTTTTPAATAPPLATTGGTSAVTTHAVTLTGTVDPQGSATTYVFQYGLKASYGSKTATRSAGSGTSATTVDATISGLQTAKTYVFRIVAKNAHGTATGLVQTFTTATPSCTNDRTAITNAERTVTQQENTVAQQRQSVTTAQTNVDTAVDATTVSQDETQVATDRTAVANAKKALGETVLRAPIAGTITAVNASVGDTVGSSSSSSGSNASGGGSGLGGGANSNASSASTSSSSSGVVTIDNLKKLEVVSGFAEADAVKVKVGQPATVTLAALTSTTVGGKVTAVSPTSTVTSNVVTYDVTITLINPPATVRDGMTADVSVTVASKANVLQLPSAAITTAGRTSTVTILANGKQTVTPVTTGLVGASTTQILTGVKAGDVVVEPTVSISATTGTGATGGFGGAGGGGFRAGGGGFGGGGFGGTP